MSYFQDSEQQLAKKLNERISNALKDNEAAVNNVNSKNPFKEARRALNESFIVLTELGYWCFSKAFVETIEKVTESFMTTPLFTVTQQEKNTIRDYLKAIHDVHLRAVLSEENENNPEMVLKHSSHKLVTLLTILSENRAKKNFHAIVFAQTKVSVFWLAKLLQEVSQLDEWSFLQSDFIYGENSGDGKIKSRMGVVRQKEALDKFRSHEINLLVATNIIEEGVDVPHCNMVIRFSRIPTFGSFVQSKGRARSSNSQFFIMAEHDEFAKDYEKDIKNFCEIEEVCVLFTLFIE
jgi:endoribonuclease Dicer